MLKFSNPRPQAFEGTGPRCDLYNNKIMINVPDNRTNYLPARRYSVFTVLLLSMVFLYGMGQTRLVDDGMQFVYQACSVNQNSKSQRSESP